MEPESLLSSVENCLTPLSPLSPSILQSRINEAHAGYIAVQHHLQVDIDNFSTAEEEGKKKFFESAENSSFTSFQGLMNELLIGMEEWTNVCSTLKGVGVIMEKIQLKQEEMEINLNNLKSEQLEKFRSSSPSLLNFKLPNEENLLTRISNTATEQVNFDSHLNVLVPPTPISVPSSFSLEPPVSFFSSSPKSINVTTSSSSPSSSSRVFFSSFLQSTFETMKEMQIACSSLAEEQQRRREEQKEEKEQINYLVQQINEIKQWTEEQKKVNSKTDQYLLDINQKFNESNSNVNSNLENFHAILSTQNKQLQHLGECTQLMHPSIEKLAINYQEVKETSECYLTESKLSKALEAFLLPLFNRQQDQVRTLVGELEQKFDYQFNTHLSNSPLTLLPAMQKQQEILTNTITNTQQHLEELSASTNEIFSKWQQETSNSRQEFRNTAEQWKETKQEIEEMKNTLATQPTDRLSDLTNLLTPISTQCNAIKSELDELNKRTESIDGATDQLRLNQQRDLYHLKEEVIADLRIQSQSQSFSHQQLSSQLSNLDQNMTNVQSAFVESEERNREQAQELRNLLTLTNSSYTSVQIATEIAPLSTVVQKNDKKIENLANKIDSIGEIMQQIHQTVTSTNEEEALRAQIRLVQSELSLAFQSTHLQLTQIIDSNVELRSVLLDETQKFEKSSAKVNAQLKEDLLEEISNSISFPITSALEKVSTLEDQTKELSKDMKGFLSLTWLGDGVTLKDAIERLSPAILGPLQTEFMKLQENLDGLIKEKEKINQHFASFASSNSISYKLLEEIQLSNGATQENLTLIPHSLQILQDIQSKLLHQQGLLEKSTVDDKNAGETLATSIGELKATIGGEFAKVNNCIITNRQQESNALAPLVSKLTQIEESSEKIAERLMEQTISIEKSIENKKMVESQVATEDNQSFSQQLEPLSTSIDIARSATQLNLAKISEVVVGQGEISSLLHSFDTRLSKIESISNPKLDNILSALTMREGNTLQESIASLSNLQQLTQLSSLSQLNHLSHLNQLQNLAKLEELSCLKKSKLDSVDFSQLETRLQEVNESLKFIANQQKEEAERVQTFFGRTSVDQITQSLHELHELLSHPSYSSHSSSTLLSLLQPTVDLVNDLVLSLRHSLHDMDENNAILMEKHGKDMATIIKILQQQKNEQKKDQVTLSPTISTSSEESNGYVVKSIKVSVEEGKSSTLGEIGEGCIMVPSSSERVPDDSSLLQSAEVRLMEQDEFGVAPSPIPKMNVEIQGLQSVQSDVSLLNNSPASHQDLMSFLQLLASQLENYEKKHDEKLLDVLNKFQHNSMTDKISSHYETIQSYLSTHETEIHSLEEQLKTLSASVPSLVSSAVESLLEPLTQQIHLAQSNSQICTERVNVLLESLPEGMSLKEAMNSLTQLSQLSELTHLSRLETLPTLTIAPISRISSQLEQVQSSLKETRASILQHQQIGQERTEEVQEEHSTLIHQMHTILNKTLPTVELLSSTLPIDLPQPDQQMQENIFKQLNELSIQVKAIQPQQPLEPRVQVLEETLLSVTGEGKGHRVLSFQKSQFDSGSALTTEMLSSSLSFTNDKEENLHPAPPLELVELTNSLSQQQQSLLFLVESLRSLSSQQTQQQLELQQNYQKQQKHEKELLLLHSQHQQQLEIIRTESEEQCILLQQLHQKVENGLQFSSRPSSPLLAPGEQPEGHLSLLEAINDMRNHLESKLKDSAEEQHKHLKEIRMKVENGLALLTQVEREQRERENTAVESLSHSLLSIRHSLHSMDENNIGLHEKRREENLFITGVLQKMQAESWFQSDLIGSLLTPNSPAFLPIHSYIRQMESHLLIPEPAFKQSELMENLAVAIKKELDERQAQERIRDERKVEHVDTSLELVGQQLVLQQNQLKTLNEELKSSTLFATESFSSLQSAMAKLTTLVVQGQNTIASCEESITGNQQQKIIAVEEMKTLVCNQLAALQAQLSAQQTEQVELKQQWATFSSSIISFSSSLESVISAVKTSEANNHIQQLGDRLNELIRSKAEPPPLGGAIEIIATLPTLFSDFHSSVKLAMEASFKEHQETEQLNFDLVNNILSKIIDLTKEAVKIGCSNSDFLSQFPPSITTPLLNFQEQLSSLQHNFDALQIKVLSLSETVTESTTPLVVSVVQTEKSLMEISSSLNGGLSNVVQKLEEMANINERSDGIPPSSLLALSESLSQQQTSILSLVNSLRSLSLQLTEHQEELQHHQIAQEKQEKKIFNMQMQEQQRNKLEENETKKQIRKIHDGVDKLLSFKMQTQTDAEKYPLINDDNSANERHSLVVASIEGLRDSVTKELHQFKADITEQGRTLHTLFPSGKAPKQPIISSSFTEVREILSSLSQSLPLSLTKLSNGMIEELNQIKDAAAESSSILLTQYQLFAPAFSQIEKHLSSLADLISQDIAIRSANSSQLEKENQRLSVQLEEILQVSTSFPQQLTEELSKHHKDSNVVLSNQQLFSSLESKIEEIMTVIQEHQNTPDVRMGISVNGAQSEMKEIEESYRTSLESLNERFTEKEKAKLELFSHFDVREERIINRLLTEMKSCNSNLSSTLSKHLLNVVEPLLIQAEKVNSVLKFTENGDFQQFISSLLKSKEFLEISNSMNLLPSIHQINKTLKDSILEQTNQLENLTLQLERINDHKLCQPSFKSFNQSSIQSTVESEEKFAEAGEGKQIEASGTDSEFTSDTETESLIPRPIIGSLSSMRKFFTAQELTRFLLIFVLGWMMAVRQEEEEKERNFHT